MDNLLAGDSSLMDGNSDLPLLPLLLLPLPGSSPTASDTQFDSVPADSSLSPSLPPSLPLSPSLSFFKNVIQFGANLVSHKYIQCTYNVHVHLDYFTLTIMYIHMYMCMYEDIFG